MQEQLKQFLQTTYTRAIGQRGLFVFLLLSQCWLGIIGLGEYPLSYTFVSFCFVLLQVLSLVALIAILPPKVGKALGIVLLVLFSLLYLFEGVTLVQNNLFYAYCVISSLVATNAGESKEFLAALNYDKLLLWVLLPYILISAIAYIAQQREPRSVHKYPLRWVYTTAVVLLLTIPTQVVLAYRQTHPAVPRVQIKAYKSTSLDRLIFNTLGYREEVKKQQEVACQFRLMPVGEVRERSPFPQDLNVVLIIGESLNRNYMHCYGYPLGTTPHIDSLIRRKEIVAYDDALSPYHNTALSVPSLMSFSTLDGSKDWYDMPLLTHIMQKAGYKTEWLSNQESLGQYAHAVNIIAKQADIQKYTTQHKAYGEANVLDERLLPLIDTTALNKGKRFRVIHLMGNHISYENRFPESYAKYQASDIPQKLDEEEKVEVAHYVNSVLYNDYIIAEIIKRHEASNTILFYISDHGQAMYNDPKHPDASGHLLSRHAMEVPLLIYLSPSLKAQMPNLYDDLAKYRKHRIQLDLLPYAITGLLGVQHQYSKAKYNFFSPEYDNTRARTLREHFGATPQETL